MRNPSDVFGCPYCGGPLTELEISPLFRCRTCEDRYDWADIIRGHRSPNGLRDVDARVPRDRVWVIRGVRVGKINTHRGGDSARIG